jgi:flagella synthesis protein FlgN
MKDALLDTIIDEYATVEAFASLLLYEQQALSTAWPGEVLKPIIEQKISMTDNLELFERTREAQLRERGLPGGKRGMDLAAAKDARLSEHWDALQKSAQRAGRLNFNNGLMVRTRMDFNRRILAVMRGTPEKAVTFYGPDGKVPSPFGV